MVRKIQEMINDRLRLQSDYRVAFESPEGKRVLSHLCKVGGINGSTYAADARLHAFKEGQRHLVLSILKFVNKQPQQIIEEEIENG